MPVTKWVGIPLGVIGHVPMARLKLLENLSQPVTARYTLHYCPLPPLPVRAELFEAWLLLTIG